MECGVVRNIMFMKPNDFLLTIAVNVIAGVILRVLNNGNKPLKPPYFTMDEFGEFRFHWGSWFQVVFWIIILFVLSFTIMD